ncbi:MAG: response regulator [Rhodocyclaceae bacterium]|jgi:CheY-like chemotaxis protein|nr:response regulator [Rhodocyclaceae bacterium]
MSESARKQRIAVVDDALVLRRIVSALLEKDYDVTAFVGGKDFLESSAPFDLILLDIDMPGMDGYEVCRRLRAREEGGEVPVIFVSGHDAAPERVAAYQAGGNDFIIKPVNADEVRHKVGAILTQMAERRQLAHHSQTASKVAFEAMTNMGELGAVMDFMRRSAACADAASVANCVLAALLPLGLSGTVQVRMPSGKVNYASLGQATPLQDSVMDSLCSMGRLFIFGSRGIVNYDHVSLLVLDLPTKDEARLGRLRDHLALLAEGAEARLAAIAATDTIVRMHDEVTRTLQALRHTLAETNRRAQDARQNAQRQTIDTLEGLGRMIQSFSITDIQRETVEHTIEDGIEDLLRLYDVASIAETDFSRVVTMLERMALERAL